MDEDSGREFQKQIEALRGQIENLKIENRKLRQEGGLEPSGWPAKDGAVAVAPALKRFCPICRAPGEVDSDFCDQCGTGFKLSAGDPAPPAPSPIFCPVCHRRVESSEQGKPCGECGYHLKPNFFALTGIRPEPPARPQGPGLSERLWGGVRRIMDSMRGLGAERIVGEKLLNHVGMFLLVLGGAFFLKHTIGISGRYGKLAIGLAAGTVLIAAGERLRRRPEFEFFSVPVIGGGWILAYYTMFAAHWIQSARIIESPALGLALLCATAGGMIGHSLKIKSRVLTVFSFASAYFVFAVTHLGMPTMTVCGILAVAGAYLVRRLKAPELAAVSVAGFYINYFPVLREVLASGPARPFPGWEFWQSLLTATAVHILYVLATPPVDEGESESPALDASLSLGSILYASFFFAQASAFDPVSASSKLLGLAAVLTGLSAATGRKGKPQALASVQAFLGAAVAALASLKLQTPAAQLWSLALSASVFGTLGHWLGRDSLGRYGLALAGLVGLVTIGQWGFLGAVRGSAGLALLFIAVTGYGLAVLRQAHGRADEAQTGAWFYAGLALSLLALRVWFAPAVFLLAGLAFALFLEKAAETLEAEPLLKQAVLLETALGVYCFAIDYGANLPILGPLTPRGLNAVCASAAFGYLAFGTPLPPGGAWGATYAAWRQTAAWLMTAIASFGVYNEFGPRLRLPVWSLSALGLLSLGRRRGHLGDSLRLQAYLLAIGTAAEGVLSYLLYPSVLMPVVGTLETSVYAVTAVSLLAPLAFRPWAEDKAEREEELGAHYLFTTLSLGLLALFVAKEFDGAYITLGWSLVGAAYLVGGILGGRQALRLPALGLLVLCVGKALFKDLTGLELPFRVLSYTVLGALLVASSYLYVRLSKQEDADAA